MGIFYYLVIASTLIQTIGYAQSVEENAKDLYMPLEVRKAYQEGTRDKSGKVPEKYWQNRSSYVINASIDPETRLLEGEARITYFNNSRDSIYSITFQAYHDYLKPYAKRGYIYDFEGHTGYNVEKVIIEGDSIDLLDRKRVDYGGTNYSVRLKDPLPAGDSLKLYFEWNYVVPMDFSRSGAIDSNSMFIAYWYPEIAVKDDIHGWDRSTYDTATEFYHDFSDYEVHLTVPDNFTVWASVPPENPQEVYDPETRHRLEQARNSVTSVSILSEEDFKSKASSQTTWKYEARNFPDFSFALSDHFLWEASMHRDEKREVFVHTAYPPDHENYVMVMSTIHESLDLFHNTFPQYPFPYDYFIIFNGSKRGGMEFPGMANNWYLNPEEAATYLGRPVTEEEVKRHYLGLAVHEMGHMYFPFLMGINEKDYAWMDEGFADFLLAFLETVEPWIPVQLQTPEILGSISRTPLMVISREHEGSWTNSYHFGSQMYYSLYHLLGEESFLRALHTFMDEWKYKHPIPYDMVYTFNRETEEDLTWFFENWLFEWGYMDLGIVAVEDQKIEIRNNGGKAVSFKIRTFSEDGETHTEVVSPAVWKNSSTYIHHSSLQDKLAKVELEIPIYGDAVTENNHWKKDEGD